MNSHRKIRYQPEAIAKVPIDKEEFGQWVNDPRTRKYLTIAHDMSIGGIVDSNNPLAGQAALSEIKKQEGAMNVINLLLNLDDPENFASFGATEEPKATYSGD